MSDAFDAVTGSESQGQPAALAAPSAQATQAPAAPSAQATQAPESDAFDAVRGSDTTTTGAAGTVDNRDYLARTEDAIHDTASSVAHTASDLGSSTLSAAGDKYRQVTAQAQAVHDAALKEFKAGHYAKAVGIITAAHAPDLANNPATGYLPRIAGQVYDYGKSIVAPAAGAVQKTAHGDFTGAMHSTEEAQGNALIPGAGTHIVKANELLQQGDKVGALKSLAHAGLNTALIAGPFLLGGTAAEGTAAEGTADVTPTTATHEYNPVSGRVAKIVKKSGLDKGGRAGMTPEGDQVTPEGVQQANQTSANLRISDAAEASGVSLPEGTTLRDAAGQMATQIKARSSAAYRQLDEASGGRWQRFDDKISNLRAKADELAGIDDIKSAQYENQASIIENEKTTVLQQLVKENKIAADTATKAVGDWKQSQALFDLDKIIKGVTRPATSTFGELTDLSKLEPRLQKLYDSGRLTDALGSSDSARILASNIRDANDSIEAAKSLPPTGQRALGDLIKANTNPKPNLWNKNAVRTNWDGVSKDYDQLSTTARREMFGLDTAKARDFISTQHRNQIVWDAAKGKSLLGKLIYLTGVEQAVVHVLFGNSKQP